MQYLAFSNKNAINNSILELSEAKPLVINYVSKEFDTLLLSNLLKQYDVNDYDIFKTEFLTAIINDNLKTNRFIIFGLVGMAYDTIYRLLVNMKFQKIKETDVVVYFDNSMRVKEDRIVDLEAINNDDDFMNLLSSVLNEGKKLF